MALRKDDFLTGGFGGGFSFSVLVFLTGWAFVVITFLGGWFSVPLIEDDELIGFLGRFWFRYVPVISFGARLLGGVGVGVWFSASVQRRYVGPEGGVCG
jgi:hypothetical protein